MYRDYAGADKAGKLRSTASAARLRGTHDLRLPYDEDTEKHFYHRTPSENVDPIRDKGFDPDMKKRGSFGTHFSGDPEHTFRYADEANSREDATSALLRVLRERVPDAVMDDPYDYHTGSRVPASDIEMYVHGDDPEGPGQWRPMHEDAPSPGGGLNELYFEPGSRFGAANDIAGGAMAVKGLYDLANQFTGNHLPTIQTPADWVMNYAMEHMPNSPYATRSSGPRDMDYGRMGHSLHGRTRPTSTDRTIYRNDEGNTLA